MVLSKSNKGALAEYRVACYLLASGNWLVFRSLTPNGSVDMVLLHHRGHLLKCQVKSAVASGAATAANPKHLRQGRNHVLAVVTPDNIVFKVINRQVQKLFPGSILARPAKKK
jgi:hypothetical protein